MEKIKALSSIVESTICHPKFAGKKCTVTVNVNELEKTVNVIFEFKEIPLFKIQYEEKTRSTVFIAKVYEENLNYPILKDIIEKVSNALETNLWEILVNENGENRSYLENLF